MRALLAFFAVLLVPMTAAAAPVYPWKPTASDPLEQRFSPPAGFTRAAVDDASFGGFLRKLPLLPPGAKVVDFRGAPLYEDGHHPNIAAVVDIDIGKGDLQQCADSVIRLHAEWRYSIGEHDVRYRSVSGTSIPYQRYVGGERVVASGNGITFVRQSGPRRDEHGLFRAYLDDVFGWASTRSLERDGAKVAFADLRAGDFFVMSGSPFGHAVLVLDVAKDGHGSTALLLGQGYMPAQSFHVLRETEQQAWFVVPDGATHVKTPFWQAFPIGSLRRL
jgi:hypothetical protein